MKQSGGLTIAKGSVSSSNKTGPVRPCTILRSIIKASGASGFKSLNGRGPFMNIYLGDLPDGITEERLEALFAVFGKIESLKIIRDRVSGRSKGFGFIEMPSNSEADKAIKALNGNPIDGKCIKVKPADSGGKRRNKRTFRRRNY